MGARRSFKTVRILELLHSNLRQRSRDQVSKTWIFLSFFVEFHGSYLSARKFHLISRLIFLAIGVGKERRKSNLTKKKCFKRGNYAFKLNLSFWGRKFENLKNFSTLFSQWVLFHMMMQFFNNLIFWGSNHDD